MILFFHKKDFPYNGTNCECAFHLVIVICTLTVGIEKIVKKFQKLYDIKETKMMCNFGIPQKYDIIDDLCNNIKIQNQLEPTFKIRSQDACKFQFSRTLCN